MLITIDRWIVLRLYGDAALGQFSLASIVLVGLLMISTLVSQQHLARTAFRYGQDRSWAALRSRARTQGLLVMSLTGCTAVATLVIAVSLIPRVMPAYEAALAPMAIGAAGTVLYSAFSGYANVLGIVRRGGLLLVLQVAAVAALLVLAGAAYSLGLGLPGIALATATSLVAFGAACAAATRFIRAPEGVPR